MECQPLEPRLLLALAFAIDKAGTLTVTGTKAADLIAVSSADDLLSVKLNKAVFSVPLTEVTKIVINGGAGNDHITFDPGVLQPSTLSGGEGNDYLAGGDFNNKLSGDAGNDTLAGSVGKDILVGGPGIDTADYSARTDDLKITLDNKPNDGAPGATKGKGEGDNVQSDIELISGGSGDDFIAGSAKGDTLRGGPGDDTLMGGAGNDFLVGGPGADSMNSGAGDDVLLAIDLSAGDTLDGGEGFDSVAYDAITDPDTLVESKDTLLNIESEVSVLNT